MLSGTPAAGTGRHLQPHLHRAQRRAADATPDLHADREPGAGHHQRQQRRRSRWARPAPSPSPRPASRRRRSAQRRRAAHRRDLLDNGNGTGTLSGTPAAGTAASTPHLHRRNGVRRDATQTFTLTVDEAPAITSAASTHVHGGTAGSFTVTTTGFPTAALSESGDAAQRRDLHRQRRRHRHAQRHAGRGTAAPTPSPSPPATACAPTPPRPSR